MREVDWKGVSMPAANAGTAAMGMANNIFNKALQTAENGLTKHQEEMEKSTAAERAANTALVLKMRGEGKNVSKEFLKELGVYDGKAINDGVMDLKKFDLEERKLKSEIAVNNSKMDPMTKALQEHALKLDFLKAETSAGKYRDKTGKGGKTGIFKVLDDANLIYNPLDSDLSTVDGNSEAENKQFVAAAVAKGVPKNVLRDVIMKNSRNGAWHSGFTGADEQVLDVEGAVQMLYKNYGMKI